MDEEQRNEFSIIVERCKQDRTRSINVPRLVWGDAIIAASIELEDLRERNEELERSLKRTAGALMQAWEAIKYALNEWFDRVYPPDIFIGGPTSDPGVNEVREVANRLREALDRKTEKE